jgi:Acetyltransferase (GNAT) domain
MPETAGTLFGTVFCGAAWSVEPGSRDNVPVAGMTGMTARGEVYDGRRTEDHEQVSEASQAMTDYREIQTERLLMRSWRDSDRAPFAALNADPAVMRYFPAPLDRAESDRLVDRTNERLERQGFGLWALEVLETDQFVGFTGLNLMLDRRSWRWRPGGRLAAGPPCLAHGLCDRGGARGTRRGATWCGTTSDLVDDRCAQPGLTGGDAAAGDGPPWALRASCA